MLPRNTREKRKALDKVLEEIGNRKDLELYECQIYVRFSRAYSALRPLILEMELYIEEKNKELP